MPFLPRPGALRTQPLSVSRWCIDWSNPLTRGLTFAWLPHPSVRMRNLATGDVGSLTSGALLAPTGTGRGIAHVGDSTARRIDFGDRILFDGAGGDVTLLLDAESVAYTDYPGIGRFAGGAGGTGMLTAFYSINTSYKRLTFGPAGGGTSARCDIDITAPHSFACCFKSTGTNNWSDYSQWIAANNGKPESVLAGGGTSGSGGASSSHILDTASVGNPFQGKIRTIMLWKRAFNQSALNELSANPWQLFRPAVPRVYFFPAGGGSTYNLDYAETASATDSLSSAATLPASLSETAGAADTCSSIATLAAAIAETLSATDSVSAGAATYAVDIAEAASAADAISGVLTAAASVVETATAADTASSVATLIAALAESVTASDTVSSSTSGSTYSVSVSEAISALDTFSAQFDLAAAIAEAASASDSTTSAAVLAAAVTEALAALDALSATGVFGVTITESANATDSVSAPTGFGETPASRTITVTRGGRTITVQLHGRTITVH